MQTWKVSVSVWAHSCFALHLNDVCHRGIFLCLQTPLRHDRMHQGGQLRPHLFIWKLPIHYFPSFSPLPRPSGITTETDSRNNWTNTEIWRALSGRLISCCVLLHTLIPCYANRCLFQNHPSPCLCFLHLTVWNSLLLLRFFCSASVFHVRQL